MKEKSNANINMLSRAIDTYPFYGQIFYTQRIRLHVTILRLFSKMDLYVEVVRLAGEMKR